MNKQNILVGGLNKYISSRSLPENTRTHANANAIPCTFGNTAHRDYTRVRLWRHVAMSSFSSCHNWRTRNRLGAVSQGGLCSECQGRQSKRVCVMGCLLSTSVKSAHAWPLHCYSTEIQLNLILRGESGYLYDFIV